jgi:hypothetical protein
MFSAFAIGSPLNLCQAARCAVPARPNQKPLTRPAGAQLAFVRHRLALACAVEGVDDVESMRRLRADAHGVDALRHEFRHLRQQAAGLRR